MGNKDKDKNQGDSAVTIEGALGDLTSPWDAHHTNRDLNWEREVREAARDAILARQVVEAIAREMEKAYAQYQAMINDISAAAMPTSLKVTSSASGFKVMDPFDWTKDKAIYQRWQLWSEKAGHALKAMEGDSEETKISYFHHWIHGEGMGHIESWKNNKILISKAECDILGKN